MAIEKKKHKIQLLRVAITIDYYLKCKIHFLTNLGY